jgi:hypothetical protein
VRRSANYLFALIAHHPDEGVIGINIPPFVLRADRDGQGTGAKRRHESFL